MSNKKHLCWDAVIATYKRYDILPLCLKLAARQSAPPTKIIVIDASPNWEESRRKVITEIAVDHPKITWLYRQASFPSTTVQRNHGVGLATSDVIFFLDDDSLMYPDCAAEIMSLYDADKNREIAGIQAADAPSPPKGLAGQKKKQSKTVHAPKLGRLTKFLYQRILLMDAEKLFIPYDGIYPDSTLVGGLSNLNIFPVKLFNGYRMTFRREFIEKEHFDPLLRYYAAGEDLDLSYRISRHGGLFESRKAKLHHFKSESGRFSPWLVSTLSVLNQAYLLKKHATSLKRSKRAFAILGLRRIPAEALKDILTMNCNFLRLTGLLFGLRCSRKLFLMAHRDISVWYPQFQKQLIDKSTSLSGSNLSPETRNQT